MRKVLRSAAATLLAVAVLPTAAASGAWAADDGADPGPGLSTGATLLIYLGIPLAAFVIIALLTYAPSLARGPRYRPGLTWFATPTWFNGPADESAQAALEPAAGAPTEADLPTHPGGGASARW